MWPFKTKKENISANYVIEAKIPGVDHDKKLDISSQTWQYVESWTTINLKKARERNDLTKLDATETAVLRGRIKLLKEILSLPNKAKGDK